MTRPRLPAWIFQASLSVLLLLSGFAGISYEILYGRLLGNLIGDQFAVSASVLITFLLGAGLGSAFAHRLWRWLWLVEFGIGAFGLAFVLGYGALEALVYAPLFAGGLGGKVLLCCLLLTAPAFLVGCSVPLFSGYLAAAGGRARFAGVYAVYNFGAALTALGLEFLLIRSVGINRTVWVFALVNFAVAACLRLGLPAPPAPSQAAPARFGRAAQAALILASLASAVFQLYMLKLAELMFGPFRENFALVLAIVLFGIAAGSALVRRFGVGFAALMAANVFGLGLLFLDLEPLLRLYAEWYEPAAERGHAWVLGLKSAVLLALMAIPSATFGATVPALLRSEHRVAKDSGHLLFVSALANSAGFLLMVFALHPYLEFGAQWLVVLALSLSAWAVHGRPWRRLAYAVPAMLFLLGLEWRLWDENLLYLSYTSFHSAEEMEDNRATLKRLDGFKGNQDIFAISEIDGTAYFFINGYISFPLNSYSEKIVGLIATMFSPRLDDALVLGLGSGSTASVVGLGFDRTDAVEINPVVRANLYRMKEWNFDMEHNPRVTFIVDDAIHYTRSTDKTYSLILNTVTSPLYFSSSKLYTEDFFRAVKKRLRPDGVYATWVDSRMGDRGFDIILKTLRASFGRCGLFYIKNTYFLLLCGEQPLAYRQTGLAGRAPLAWQELLRKYNLLPDFMPYNLLTTRALELVGDESVPVNRLDFPALENEMAGLGKKGMPLTRQRVAARMEIEEVRRAAAPDVADWNPAALAVQAEQLLGKTYITTRWRELAREALADYDAAHDEAVLGYFALRAASANTALAYHKYGYQLLKRSRYEEALLQFKGALALDPAFDNANFNMGACYQYLGDWARAEEYYRRELAVDPSDEDAMARLLKVLRRRAEAAPG